MRAFALFFVVVFYCSYEAATQEKKDDRKFVPPPPPVYPDPPLPPAPPKKVEQILSTRARFADVELVNVKIDILGYERKTVSGLKQLEAGKRLIVRVRITNVGDEKLVYTPWHSDDKSSALATDESGQSYKAWNGGIGSRPAGGLWQKITIAPKKSVEDVIAFGAPQFAAEEITFTLPGSNVGASGKLTFRIGRAFFDDEPTRRKLIAKQFEDAKKTHALRIAEIKADYEAEVAQAKEEFDTLPMRLEKERLAKIAAGKESREKAERERLAKIAAEKELKEKADLEAKLAKEKAELAVTTAGGMSVCAMFGLAILVIGSIALNLMPVWICIYRNHPDTMAITVITIVFGWTCVGWWIALIWAVKSIPMPSNVNVTINQGGGHRGSDNPFDLS
jgi:Superinfection immunity protein